MATRHTGSGPTDTTHTEVSDEALVLAASALVHTVCGPQLVGLTDAAMRPRPFDIELVVRRPLRDDDPADDLIGRVIDPRWSTVGVLANGRALRTSSAGSSDSAAHDAGRHDVRPASGFDTTTAVSVAHLLHRSGRTLTALRVAGGRVTIIGPESAPTRGRIPDACRRLLGLATSPPDPIQAFLVDLWLASCARRSIGRPGLDWPTAVSLVPLTRTSAATIDSTADLDIRPAACAATFHHLAATVTWPRLRSICAVTGLAPVDGVSAAHANWMDDGMFARTVHAQLPERVALLDMIAATAHPGTTDRIHATLGLLVPDRHDVPQPPGRDATRFPPG